MGVVYRAHARALGRDVAVKVLDLAAATELDRERFRREARAHAQLEHPHLVRVLSAAPDAAVPHMLLELVDGATLAALLARRAGPPAARTGAELAAALACVHAAGLAHRDLKPANVMVRAGGGAVLMDLGLVRAEQARGPALTAPGMLVGTVAYMAPEVLAGARPDAAADVYALGLVLYELACGTTVFVGQIGTVDRVKGRIPPLAGRAVDVSGDYVRVVEQCLALDPAARPAAAAVAAALARSAAHHGPSRVGSRGDTVIPPVVAGGVRAGGRMAPAAEQRAGRHATLAALAIISGLAASWMLRDSTKRDVRSLRPVPEPTVASAGPVSEPAVPYEAPMALIPEGEFTMGTDAGDGAADERPARRVWLSGFYMDRFEVSNVDYDRFCRETGHRPRLRFPKQDAALDRADHPVVGVSWRDASDFARWAGKRLPTEAEWEKACRGPHGQPFPWGSQLPKSGPPVNYRDRSWRPARVEDREALTLAPLEWDDHFPVTAPVTALPGGDSPYGMRHMLGNAAEWCADWYAPDTYSRPAGRDPQGPETGTERVLRGASWGTQLLDLRATLRLQRQAPDERNEYIGFRCVRPAR